MRLRLRCGRASTFPTTIVRMARMIMTWPQSDQAEPAAMMNSLAKPRKAAALTAVAMKAVTGVGAPSYTSGAQLWNGTAETLKPKPVTSEDEGHDEEPAGRHAAAGEPAQAGGDAGVARRARGRVEHAPGRTRGWPRRRRR